MSNKITAPSALLALLILYSGCNSDNPSAPDPQIDAGSAQFRYSSPGLTGNFSAEGRFERDGSGNMLEQSFATAVDVTLPQYQLAYYGVVAAHFYPPEFDDLSILLSGQLQGEYPIMTADECGVMIDRGLEPCSAIGFDFHLTMDGRYPPEAASFELVDGIVTVTSVADGRLKGTFSGIARQFGDWSSGELYKPGIEVEIVDGAFDVPIITLDHWTGSRLQNPDILAPLKSRQPI